MPLTGQGRLTGWIAVGARPRGCGKRAGGREIGNHRSICLRYAVSTRAESFLLRCLSHGETNPERDASPRVDLPGFYPAVYPGFTVRDCLSRTSTENKLSRNPRGTFYLVGGCKQHACRSSFRNAAKKRYKNRHERT
jgi:hypothetical protein